MFRRTLISFAVRLDVGLYLVIDNPENFLWPH